ncbi:uncharacterized protein [Antedon mediterranea]|uniref:uncharacterized protein n=1 Tax=Antedon mediterranea TaxID=105859 RepID=UPI003AF8A1FB
MHSGFSNMFFTIAVQLVVIHIVKSAAQTDTEACNSCCTPGIPGIPGNHGNTGVSGPQGMNGVKGEQGMKGNDGSKGEQGIKGEQGMKGDDGSKGLDGIPGKLGPMGSQGIIGLPGRNGVKGEKGMKGTQGIKGDNGRNGLDGIRGPKGNQGLTGLPGANGIKGEKGKQASQKKSAFTAIFTSSPGRHAVSPMKYNSIITNVGNHYNKNTGKFVCAIPGVYVFQVTSRKSNGNSQSVSTKIMKNGSFQITTISESDYNDSASTMVVLDLISGDEVWTQPYSTTSNYYYSSSYGHCSFSGFLLYAA